MTIFYVMLGGALGALARYSTVQAMSKIIPDYPLGTLTVNLAGSFFIGLLWSIFDQPGTATRAFLFVGILGGFTTFSAFSIETLTLFREGQFKLGIVHVLLNNIGGITLAFIGMLLGKALK